MKLPGLRGEWMVPDHIEVNEAGVPTYTWNLEMGMKEFKPLSKQDLKTLLGRVDEQAHHGEGINVTKDDTVTLIREVEFWRNLADVWEKDGSASTAFLLGMKDWERISAPPKPPEKMLTVRTPTGMTVAVLCPTCGETISDVDMGMKGTPIVATCRNFHRWKRVV